MNKIKNIESKILNVYNNINNKYPELNTTSDSDREKIKAYYQIEHLEHQKKYNKLIIALQIFNVILLAFLIYVTWIK